MKFDQLAYNTPSSIRARTSSVSVSQAREEYVSDLDGMAYTFRTGTRGIPYISWVYVDSSDDVFVSCSCPYFLYNLEVALTDAGASVIRYSNGAYPSVRNPFMHVHLCKHLHRVWQFRGMYDIRYRAPEEEFPEVPEEIIEVEEPAAPPPPTPPPPPPPPAPPPPTPPPEPQVPEEEPPAPQEVFEPEVPVTEAWRRPAPEQPPVLPFEEEPEEETPVEPWRPPPRPSPTIRPRRTRPPRPGPTGPVLPFEEGT